MGPIYPNPQTDIGPRAALNQKVAWNQKIIFLRDLQVLFYSRPKNSKLFIANLEMDPFWGILTTTWAYRLCQIGLAGRPAGPQAGKSTIPLPEAHFTRE